ncbi:MAG: glycosyltransferase [Deferribacterales bacterium]
MFRPDIRQNFDISVLTGACKGVLWFIIEIIQHGEGFFDYLDRLNSPVSDQYQTTHIKISRLIYIFFMSQKDTITVYDINTHESRQNLLRIWMDARDRILSGLHCSDDKWLDDAYSISGDCKILTNVMLFMHQLRADLSEAFDLNDKKQLYGYVCWLLGSSIISETPFIKEHALWYKQMMSEKYDQIEMKTPVSITFGMYVFFECHPELFENKDINSVKCQIELIDRWLTERKSISILKLADHKSWFDGLSEYPYEKSDFNAFMYFLMMKIKDVDDVNNLTDADMVSFAAWLKLNKEDVLKIYMISGENGDIASALDYAAEYAGKFCKGINLIGMATADMGIGEDLRMTAEALVNAGMPFNIYEFPKDMHCSFTSTSHSQYINNRISYAVNIFCLPASSIIKAYFHDSGIFEGRYNIAYTQWEFDDLPMVIGESFVEIIDEVWGISSFVAQAFSKATDKPVMAMKSSLYIENNKEYKRSHFKLPEDKFLFIFTFDGNSNLNRKNPLACVDAFLSAFGGTDANVGLVIKCMNTSNVSDWQQYAEKIKSSGNIYLIEENLPKNEVMELVRSCDAFVSLHRSEGFGRGIAEAMLMDKAVVVTGYSGNMDFTLDDTAFLVSGKLEKVKKGQYLFAEGCMWMTASVADAADKMKECYYNTPLREAKIKNARALIETNHSTYAQGRALTERINTIFDEYIWEN